MAGRGLAWLGAAWRGEAGFFRRDAQASRRHPEGMHHDRDRCREGVREAATGQDCYNEPWPQLKVLEHEMGGTYHHEDLGQASTWRFPDGSKLYVLNSSRVFVG